MPVKVYDGTNWVTVAGDGAQGTAGADATSSSIATWVKTASGGETSVSGTGDTGYGTLAYTVGQELVYLNGVLLDRGDDYTATNGTSITGLTALLANDIVTVWTVNSFSVANTYTQAQSDALYPAKIGSVLQVVSSYISTANLFSTTSSTYVDATGVSLAITPTSATSKILAIFDIGIMTYGSSGNNIYASAQILRGSTPTWSGLVSGIALGSTQNIEFGTNRPLIHLDSPATTSATTYKLQLKRDSGTIGVNTNGLVSSITLMEIGA
jgi:hypothetical protein